MTPPTYSRSRSGSVMLQPGGNFSGSTRGLDCRGHGFLFARAGAAGDLNRPTYDVARSGSSISIVKFLSLGMSLIRSFADGTYSACTSLGCPCAAWRFFAFVSGAFWRFLPLCGLNSIGDFDCDFAFLAGMTLVGVFSTTWPFLFLVNAVVVPSILNKGSLMQPDCGRCVAII